MTTPTTFPFSRFKVLVEDPANAGTYLAPCGFTQRSLKLSATAEETNVPDCANEDAPTWPIRDISVLSASINGQGVLTLDNAPFWRTWFLSGAARNVRVGPADRPLAEGGGYYQGAAVLTSCEEASEKGKRVTLNVQLDSSGPWAWTAASA